jgi:hypothetical protein
VVVDTGRTAHAYRWKLRCARNSYLCPRFGEIGRCDPQVAIVGERLLDQRLDP